MSLVFICPIGQLNLIESQPSCEARIGKEGKNFVMYHAGVVYMLNYGFPHMKKAASAGRGHIIK